MSADPPQEGRPPRFASVSDWLAWQQTLNPRAIELGLDRVVAVWARLGPARLPCPLITVGGTNGKGSCVAFLEAIYHAAGYRTCVYTSPHLLRYNERIRIDGVEIDDAALCAAFARVDQARGDIPLTYFEFGTLAALDLFVRAGPDLVILEVGLGGRLDAVNLLDADVAIVTSIGRDHTAWLGEDLGAIALEKAGIFRADRPAVIAQRSPPPALRARAEALGSQVLQLGREFDGAAGEGSEVWSWRGPDRHRLNLPTPVLRGAFQRDNAAAALMAARCLGARLPVAAAALRQGLQRARLAGRFQVLPGSPTWILDVAHNADAAAALAGNLAALPRTGRCHAVLAVLADKEPAALAGPLRPFIDAWHLTSTDDPRALPAADLAAALADVTAGAEAHTYKGIEDAFEGVAQAAAGPDTILVVGSFTTVEAALRRLAATGVAEARLSH
ncbi:folylpolyglutamate synthase/dihydrofolate synthase [Thioflavicoccus mobilis 8321]|uniref:Dihydrofolate synthase/folylpolyglutamate synthase n=1 Tax=Thioflavicoccus mobilis 8321 TaxID=765912 RepID=L0GZH3_9GAMM|nr:bifunctional tetrahydrofolate synthase/dihydrofolate synthase [Thioflavicoccus mobilis]AGA91366.1 folylpolyglutamate synthase/dihydrofolate synthase [Thioflavicoccus mobilis 8321]